MKKSALISADYLEEQIRLHAAPRGYGQRGYKWADTVLMLAKQHGCASALDYGCGQGSLAKAVVPTLPIREYDPAIPGKQRLPEPADLVICTDVLEHIESDRIWFVMQHLAQLTRRVAFVVVSTVPASKTLSDGRQAHILLRSVEWWRTQCRAHNFVILEEPAIRLQKQWVAVLTRSAP